MKINIVEIYKKNIEEKFNCTNKFDYQKAFTKKERIMWQFTLELGKDNFPKQVYDSFFDAKYLNEYLSLFLLGEDVIPFTIEEWFAFLKSKE